MVATYASHFLVPYAVTAYLWIRDRPRWRAWLVALQRRNWQSL